MLRTSLLDNVDFLNIKEWPLLRLDNYQTRTQSPLFKQMRRDQLPLKMKKAACDGMPCAISEERSASSGPWKPESLLALRASRAQFCRETTVAEHPLCSELKERLALEPGSGVRDVLAYGDCFFLAANIGRQELRLATRTASHMELEAAGRRYRAAVAELMRARGCRDGRRRSAGSGLRCRLGLGRWRR
jgi:hypothetical protein